MISSDTATSAVATVERVLTVNPHLCVVQCSEDEILVRHGARSLYSQVIADAERRHLLGQLVAAFREPTSLQALLDAETVGAKDSDAASQFVGSLLEAGVLADPAPTMAELYLSTLVGRGSDAMRSQSRSSTIGLVGNGPLGSLISRDLEEFGMDVVPGESTSREGLTALLDRTDLVVVASEVFSPRLFNAVNDAAVAAEAPWMLVYLDGGEAVIGPITVPGETACYYEFEVQSEASLAQRDSYYLYKEHLQQAAPTEGYGLPTHVQVAGGFAVTALLRHLLEGNGPTVNRVLRIDLERFSIDYQSVLRLPRCPACSENRPAYRQLFL